MTERSWVQTPTMETIFQAPFIWIKGWNKNCGKLWPGIVAYAVTLQNGRVDFEEWLAYKIQLHGIEWIVSLSANWDQSPKKKRDFFHIYDWIKTQTFFCLFWFCLFVACRDIHQGKATPSCQTKKSFPNKKVFQLLSFPLNFFPQLISCHSFVTSILLFI